MVLKYDKYNRPVAPKIYLGTPNNKKICQLDGVDASSFKYTSNLTNTHEISFDVDRKDIQLINRLNDILNLLLYETPLEEWECQTCILFTKGLLFTISTYDINMYKGGFCSDGVLYIPLPHHAGTGDCIEIKIDEFDVEFNSFCEQYQEYECF